MAKVKNSEQNIIKIIKSFDVEKINPKILIYGKENLLKKQFVDRIKQSANADFHLKN